MKCKFCRSWTLQLGNERVKIRRDGRHYFKGSARNCERTRRPRRRHYTRQAIAHRHGPGTGGHGSAINRIVANQRSSLTATCRAVDLGELHRRPRPPSSTGSETTRSTAPLPRPSDVHQHRSLRHSRGVLGVLAEGKPTRATGLTYQRISIARRERHAPISRRRSGRPRCRSRSARRHCPPMPLVSQRWLRSTPGSWTTSSRQCRT